MANFEHFAVYAEDSTALKDFYVAAFGLHVCVESGGDPPGYFVADDAGMSLEIIGRPKGESGVNQRWICHLAFWVDDFAKARSDLAALGVVFETETAADNENIKTAFFCDPAGNRVQIVWRKKRLTE